jgi:hypothetical protein
MTISGSKCWDCAKYNSGCSWAENFTPIEGWVATPTKNAYGIESYTVYDCPEFVRDAYNSGLRRMKDGPKVVKEF